MQVRPLFKAKLCFSVLQDGGKHEAAKPEPAASEAVNGDAAPDKGSKPAGGEAGKDGKSEKEKTKEKEKPKKKYKVNEELLQAFRYFDRNCECCSPVWLSYNLL